MQYINLTPHVVRLNDGTEFAPSGQIARVAQKLAETEADGNIRFFKAEFGPVEGLPETLPDTMYIVSGMVRDRAIAAGRNDVVAPVTNGPEVVRREGQIWSVPGFIRG